MESLDTNMTTMPISKRMPMGMPSARFTQSSQPPPAGIIPKSGRREPSPCPVHNELFLNRGGSRRRKEVHETAVGIRIRVCEHTGRGKNTRPFCRAAKVPASLSMIDYLCPKTTTSGPTSRYAASAASLGQTDDHGLHF